MTTYSYVIPLYRHIILSIFVLSSNTMSFPFTFRTLGRQLINFHTKIPQITISNRQFRNLNPIELPKELDILKPVDRVVLNQVKVINRAPAANNTGEIATILLQASDKRNKPLYFIEFYRGQLPKEYIINVYGVDDKNLIIAEMHLDRTIKHRAFIMRVTSPPGNLIGSVYELPGISRVGIIENGLRETILQILTNEGFGWATNATILDAIGGKKLGRMYTLKGRPKPGTASVRNSLHMTIHFPKDLNSPAKIILIGTCLLLMGRYHV